MPGTGPNGRITRTDLEGFGGDGGAQAPTAGAAPAARPAAAPAMVEVHAPATAEGDEHVPLRGLRGKISEQMLRSKQHSPHFTFADECDVTELVALRGQMKERAAKRGVKLTYLPFILKAVVSAFQEYPSLNGVTDDAAGEFVIKHYFNFGIAVKF